MNKLRITITGESPKTLTSNRTGKDFSLLDVYVHGSAPYPEKVSIFENPNLPRGIYDVPVSFVVNNGRLQVNFDFKNATVADTK